MTTGLYHGRLECDGQGNLLAAEGEHKGYPVAFHEGSYVFVQPGEPSHNDRHHQQFVSFEGTVDQSMTDDETLVNSDHDTNPHHFEVQEDDAHYDENSPNHTRLSFHPDAIAAQVTSHTEASHE